MAACASLAVEMLDWPARAQYAGLAGAAFAFLLLALAIDRRWSEFQVRGLLQRTPEDESEDVALGFAAGSSGDAGARRNA